jgi:hypothetical protein
MSAHVQANAIKFVGLHGGMFATPQPDGSIYIYFRTSGPIAESVQRQRATTPAEVRAILGY